MRTVEIRPVAVTGTRGTGFGSSTFGRRRTAITTSGITLRTVRIFSVVPERLIPIRLIAQNIPMMRSSRKRIPSIPKNERLLPDAGGNRCYPQNP